MKKRKVFIPFFIILFLFAEGIYGLTKGIEHHETWRIVLASIGLRIGVFLVSFLVRRIFGKENKVS
jgi:hypothetical protein